MSLLVIETNDETIRAAVVKWTIKGGYQVSNLVKIKRSDEYEIITESEIRAVKLLIEDCPEKVIVANSSVMLIEVFMNKNKVRKMGKTQLKQALKWEVEQYVPDNMVGYDVCCLSKKEKKKDIDSRIWVSVIPKSDYFSLEDKFFREGLTLKNIYPSDTCFPMAKNRDDSKCGIFSTNINERTIKITYFKNKTAIKFIEIPLGSEDILFNIDNQTTEYVKDIITEAFNQMSFKDDLFGVNVNDEVKFIARKEKSQDEFVILSGVGASNKVVVDFMANILPLHVEVVDIKTEGEELEDNIVVTEYASVLGAGIRQLSIDPKVRTIGINNNPTLMMIIKKEPYITAGVTVAAIFLVLGTSYLFMRFRIHRNDNKITKLTNIKTEYENLQAENTRINEEKKETIEEMESDTDKIIFLSEEIDQRRESIVALLRSVKASSKSDLKVSIVEPTNTDLSEFIIRGQSNSLSSINSFITGLQDQPWCQYARLLSVGKVSPPKIEVEENVNEIAGEDEEPVVVKVEPVITFHTFDMRVVFN